jgi:hypothetical protein
MEEMMRERLLSLRTGWISREREREREKGDRGSRGTNPGASNEMGRVLEGDGEGGREEGDKGEIDTDQAEKAGRRRTANKKEK